VDVSIILEETFACLGPGLDSSMNVHSAAGLKKLACMLAMVRPQGLAWWSPTCSTWVWLNRGTSLRGIEPITVFKT